MATQLERARDIEDARAFLSDVLREGSTVHAVIRSVSASGMSRTMSLYVVSDRYGSPQIVNVTWHVSKLLGYSLRDVHGHRVIRVHGAGMDMVFAVVYDLSNTLFGNGDALRHGVL